MSVYESSKPCPCGFKGASFDAKKSSLSKVLSYAACCAPLIDGAKPAPDPSTLMRSRYTAFVLEKEQYLLNTWHPSHRPKRIEFEEGIKWLGLELRQYAQKGADSVEVEFVARYRIGGKGVRLHERSSFAKHNCCWVYTEGEILSK